MNNTHTHKEFKSGFVAIIGRPNVGKSTLTNELLGQKVVITSHKAQTTRHQIQVIDSTDEYQMVLLDTPGMHIGNASPLNSYMNKSASSSLADADVVLWLLEAGIWTKEDTRVLEHLQNISVPVIICINKLIRLLIRKNYCIILQMYQKNIMLMNYFQCRVLTIKILKNFAH
jgi:GTP-binding protein Era